MDWRYNQPASSSRPSYYNREQYYSDSDEDYSSQNRPNQQYNYEPNDSCERTPYLSSESPTRQTEVEESKKGKTSMSSWLSRTTSSSQAQFAATALVSGAVVAGAIFGYQHVRRQERVEDLKSSIPELGKGHEADKVRF